MSRILTDNEIQSLLLESKPLPDNWKNQIQLKPKQGYQHEESYFEIEGEKSNIFRIILRKNRINHFDFSIILVFKDKDKKEYRLIRCNGKHSSQHTNRFEKEQNSSNYKIGPGFHIHQATERYQEAGFDIDGYADITEKYYDYRSALNYFFKTYNFKKPESAQLELIDGGDFI